MSSFSFFSIFIAYSITVVPIFFPFASLHPAHPLFPQSIPTPLSMTMGHTYIFFDQSLPFFQSVPTSHSPLTAASLPCFCASGYILLVHLFCSLDSSEIIWHLSFIVWLILFNTIVSSYIHAVTKGKNDFFFTSEQYSTV